MKIIYIIMESFFDIKYELNNEIEEDKINKTSIN